MCSFLGWTQRGNKTHQRACTYSLLIKKLAINLREKDRGKSQHYQTKQRLIGQHRKWVLWMLQWWPKEIKWPAPSSRWASKDKSDLTQAVEKPRTWWGQKAGLEVKYWKVGWANTSAEHQNCPAEKCIMKKVLEKMGTGSWYQWQWSWWLLNVLVLLSVLILP